ncbi:3D domain-containing protein [Zunongwangia sp.]|uniref:3D domain-containing protein n=1 Tax=Zunongwangia sp. TaxID=1965325 RepID=UPI003AA97D3F
MKEKYSKICLLLLLLGAFSCKYYSKKEQAKKKIEPNIYTDTLLVTVSAFNSVKQQTNYENPDIAAWGDTLKPGMNAIAVSRDLLAKGISHNSKIKIEGFDSIFFVKDKMNSKWRNRIDIYMGTNIKKATRFGRKKLTIYILKGTIQK